MRRIMGVPSIVIRRPREFCGPVPPFIPPLPTFDNCGSERRLRCVATFTSSMSTRRSPLAHHSVAAALLLDRWAKLPPTPRSPAPVAPKRTVRAGYSGAWRLMNASTGSSGSWSFRLCRCESRDRRRSYSLFRIETHNASSNRHRRDRIEARVLRTVRPCMLATDAPRGDNERRVSSTSAHVGLLRLRRPSCRRAPTPGYPSPRSLYRARRARTDCLLPLQNHVVLRAMSRTPESSSARTSRSW